MTKYANQIVLFEEVVALKNIVAPRWGDLDCKITKKGKFMAFFVDNPSQEVDLMETKNRLLDLQKYQQEDQEKVDREQRIVKTILTVLDKEDLAWFLSRFSDYGDVSINDDFTVS